MSDLQTLVLAKASEAKKSEVSMTRRGFLSVLVAVCAAPLALLRKPRLSCVWRNRLELTGACDPKTWFMSSHDQRLMATQGIAFDVEKYKHLMAFRGGDLALLAGRVSG